MELPHMGKQCMENFCKKLDFLPINCDACHQIFCNDHYTYSAHNCQNAYLKNNQVPVCPLCNIPIPVPRGQQPDFAVGAHIDNDCQSDPAKSRRKVFTNKCSRKGCKTKEIIPVICSECTFNYCLKHRHPTDHNCEGKAGALRKQALDAALSRQNRGKSSNQQRSNGYSSTVQGNMSEDEALARALALSMQDSGSASMSQEDLDLALARQLQEAESPITVNRPAQNGRCNLQ